MRLTVGIITYNPDIETVLQTLAQLSAPDVKLVVVDNASANQAELSQAVRAADKVECIALPENLGFAAAANLLLAHAQAAGTPYLMLLDQDTRLAPDHCQLLLDQFLQARQRCPELGALGASIYDAHRQRLNRFKRFRPFWRQPRQQLPEGLVAADFLISSGTLLALDCLLDVGPMNEWLFIDSVDLDWCFRASARGWVLAGAEKPVQQQAIGNHVLSFMGKSTRIRVHEPERYYTMTRNRRFLYRQSYSPWLWRLRDLPRAILKCAVLLCQAPQRKAIASAHWRGLRAGLMSEQEHTA